MKFAASTLNRFLSCSALFGVASTTSSQIKPLPGLQPLSEEQSRGDTGSPNEESGAVMFSPGTMQVPLEAHISNSSMPSDEVSLPFARIFQAPSCVLGLSIALLALHLASFFFKLLPWKGPFLRKLTRLDALPEEKEENTVPVWKHVVMTLLAIALAAGHCVCAGYGAAFSSSRKDSLAHFATSGVYVSVLFTPRSDSAAPAHCCLSQFLAAFTLLANPPKTPEPALLSFYGWQWLVSSSALFRWSDDRYALMCATSVEWLVLVSKFVPHSNNKLRMSVAAVDFPAGVLHDASPPAVSTQGLRSRWHKPIIRRNEPRGYRHALVFRHLRLRLSTALGCDRSHPKGR